MEWSVKWITSALEVCDHECGDGRWRFGTLDHEFDEFHPFKSQTDRYLGMHACDVQIRSAVAITGMAKTITMCRRRVSRGGVDDYLCIREDEKTASHHYLSLCF
jgi:hypothetical protein